MSVGKVYLVGAGPGDPGLLTCKGRAILERCEVVVYDRLANPCLLDLAPANAERIYVGKGPGNHAMTQEEINACLVEHGLAGKQVCRLKGGDPFVFGRGGEEALSCLEAGIPWEVVPGISSSIAAPAYAGIPVTHRNVATSFAVITGHENPDKPDTQVDWSGIARAADTLVFLMGVGNLPEICRNLIDEGRDPATPVALVRWGTRPEQRSLRGTLADIVAKVEAAGFKPPAVTIVGEVVNLQEQLSWFENRPLHGKAVVVTRSRTQSSDLREQLETLGAEVIEFPVIAIQPRDVSATATAMVEDGLAADWVVFTSTNAVNVLCDAVWAAGGDARVFAGVRLGAVGKATAKAMEARGLRADFVPSSFSAADFVAEFPDAAGARILFPAASQASSTVRDELTAKGCVVTVLPVYDTVLDGADADVVRSRLTAGEVAAVTFTSSSTAENFRELLPDADLSGVVTVSIGPQTTATMQRLGIPPTVEASESTIAGVVAALAAELSQS